jgi:hypothetical protein
MVPFFPHQTIEWKLHEPPFLRRLSLSLGWMAVITGIAMRSYRWLVLSHEPLTWWLFFATFAGGLGILFALATAHLGNYTVRQWIWRAPLFAIVEGATESAMSALFIALGIERIGTRLAHWPDWPELVQQAFVRRLGFLLIFTLILAAVVQWVRWELLRREHRMGGD